MLENVRKLGGRLFYQIAFRLAGIALLFAGLQIVIVIVMYVHDPETLSEDLVTLESARIEKLLDANGINPAPIAMFFRSPTRALWLYDEHGTRILAENPGNLPTPDAPIADLQAATSREMNGARFYLTGTRQIDVNHHKYWVVLAISGSGLSPLMPALFKEVYEHALLPLIPLSMLLLLFNVVIVRRMLTPLERAVVDVDALDPDDLTRRLHQPESPVEVRTLLRAVNRALDRLEGAMRTMRRFTADAAHELRTPLTVMSLTVDRLPTSPDKDKLQEDARTMTRLIGQLLDLARADTPEEKTSLRSDLDELARRIAAELTPMIVAAGRKVRFSSAGSAQVAGREEALERAVRNLVENALLHGAGDIDINVGPGPRIEVRDHGPGIPADLRDKVFERFWRADSRKSGAGLGLAITKRIVESCGGRIEISEAIDGGASIALLFPDPAVKLSA